MNWKNKFCDDGVSTPHTTQSKIKLGVQMGTLDEPLHTSDVISVLSNQLPSPYQPITDLDLAVEGHVVVTLPITHRGVLKQVGDWLVCNVLADVIFKF